MLFGENTEERLGKVIPLDQDKLKFIEGGNNISLGSREIQVIHTPGHDPYHFSYVDTVSEGIFIGDCVSYNEEFDLIIPPNVWGTEFYINLESIKRIQDLKPEVIYFSHGSTRNDVSRCMKLAQENTRACLDTTLKGFRAGEDTDKIAMRLIDVITNDSEPARQKFTEDLQLTIMGVEAYRYFFQKKKMI